MDEPMTLWQRWNKGACRGLHEDDINRIFFPPPGRPKKIPPHEAYCSSCPIINFCGAYAVVYDEEGIWGNMTKNQRDSLIAMSPRLKTELQEEGKRQGWYVPRLTVEELLAQEFGIVEPEETPVPAPQFELPLIIPFEQTLGEPLMSRSESPKAAAPVGSTTDQYEDSILFPLIPEFHVHDTHQSSKQPMRS